MLTPDYRDPQRERAVNWLARLSWIYGLLITPPALFLIAASPFLALDCGYILTALIVLSPSSVGLALSHAGKKKLAEHDDNSFIVRTLRESKRGSTINGALLIFALLSLLLLTGRTADLQHNRDTAIQVHNETRGLKLLQGYQDYGQKFNGAPSPSLSVLLHSGLVRPADIALAPADAPLLQRAANGDMTITDADIEKATGIKYLGTGSGIHAKSRENQGEVILFGTKPIRGEILMVWSDGTIEYRSPNDLDKPLPSLK